MEKTIQSIEETNRLIWFSFKKLDALVTNQEKLKYQIHAVTNLMTGIVEGFTLTMTTSRIIQVIIIILLTLSVLNFLLSIWKLGSGYFRKK